MTTITDLNHAIDMSSFNLGDLTGGTIVRHDAAVTITGAGGVYTYSFTGSGFGEGSSLPSGGTLTGVSIVGTDGTNLTITDFSVSVSSLFLVFLFGTFVDFENAILGGNDTINGSTQSDHVFAYNGDDTFNMARGGHDTALGGAGNDTFNFGAKFDAGDRIDGGDDMDKVVLKGNYSGGVTLANDTMINVESVLLSNNNSYKLALADGNVGAGKSLTVDGSKIDATHTVNIDGSAELDGNLKLKGGAGADTLVGGAHGNTITGGLGGDAMTAGAGKDVFVYKAVAESNAASHDTIAGLNFNKDKIDLSFAVNTVETPVNAKLSAASLDHDLKAALGSLGAHDAILVTGHGGGTLDGHVFLVVDANGTVGYQNNAEYVIDVTGATGHVATTTFI
jgi:Ca2+-binding RTX toxin-like protein